MAARAKKWPTIKWPIVLYSDAPSHNGIVVGKVHSGKVQRAEGMVIRHVAFDENGNRLGSFTAYEDAKVAVKRDFVRRNPLPPEVTVAGL